MKRTTGQVSDPLLVQYMPSQLIKVYIYMCICGLGNSPWSSCKRL